MSSTISHLVITFDIEVKSSDAAPVTGLIVVVGPIFSSLRPNACCRPYINLSHNSTDRFRSQCRFRSFGIYAIKRCVLQIFMPAYQFLIYVILYNICETIKCLPDKSTLRIHRSKYYHQEMLILVFLNLPWSKERSRVRVMLFRKRKSILKFLYAPLLVVFYCLRICMEIMRTNTKISLEW